MGVTPGKKLPVAYQIFPKGGVKMGRAQKLVDKSVISIQSATEVNREGYSAFAHGGKEAYLKLLLTNTWSNTFYDRDDQQMLQSVELHESMANQDSEYLAKALVYARNVGFMRLQPIYGLAKIAYSSPDLFAKIFYHVTRIPSDLFDFLTIMKMLYKTEGSSRIKKIIKRWFEDNISEYWITKYNGRGRGYNLTDVVRLVHPVPEDDYYKDMYDYLANDNQEAADRLVVIGAVKKLKENSSNMTEDEIINLIHQNDLYHEAVTSTIKPTEKVWRALSYQMPVFALLRHLVTLERNNAVDIELIKSKLNSEAVQYAKIFPFRLLSAYDKVQDAELKGILETVIEDSLVNIPKVKGNTAVFLDVSGSMEGNEIKKASMYALTLMKRTNGNSLLWLFDTEVVPFEFSSERSVLEQANSIFTRGGTNVAAPFFKLRTENIKVDQIVVITDEQQNTGTHAMMEYARYRRDVNPNVKLFVVNVSPYNNTLFDPKDYKEDIYFIHGFSDSAVKYISMMLEGMHSLVQQVEEIDINDLS